MNKEGDSTVEISHTEENKSIKLGKVLEKVSLGIKGMVTCPKSLVLTDKLTLLTMVWFRNHKK